MTVFMAGMEGIIQWPIKLAKKGGGDLSYILYRARRCREDLYVDKLLKQLGQRRHYL